MVNCFSSDFLKETLNASFFKTDHVSLEKIKILLINRLILTSIWRQNRWKLLSEVFKFLSRTALKFKLLFMLSLDSFENKRFFYFRLLLPG